MRVSCLAVILASLLSGPQLATAAGNGEEAQLIKAINSYRSQVQRCGDRASEELTPVSLDARLILSATGSGDLHSALASAGYQMVNVQAISLSGPRDAQSAMDVIKESFCHVVLDPQYANIGVSREGRDWRIVLARQLLGSHLKDSLTEGQMLLEEINRVRGQARQCGEGSFAAAPPLAWNGVLAQVAETQSRAMANGNFFSPLDPEGRTPGDRAELAGYEGLQIGQNIAAALDRTSDLVEGWLASPGHCTNIMNPQFTELGAGYAIDPQSDAGIYWVATFGGQ